MKRSPPHCSPLDALRRAVRPLFLGFTLTEGALLVSGCSRSATREDCDRIITRGVELRAKEQHQTDPAVVEKAIADFKREHASEIEASCVGRSLKKDVMKCVEQAETSDAVDACLY